MMNRHRVRRDGTARVDEPRPALFSDLPLSNVIDDDILPADLANVVRAITACFEIDDAYPGFDHFGATFLQASALVSAIGIGWFLNMRPADSGACMH